MARLRGIHSMTMLGAAIPAAEEVERMGVERDAVGDVRPGTLAAVAYEALWLDVCRRLGVTRRGANTLR